MKKIIKVLESKYGEYVKNQLVTDDGRAILNGVEKQRKEEQTKVMEHIKSLSDKNGEKLIPENFLLNEKVEWGVDFSSWLGSLETQKKYMFIGAEPHIVKGNNYQLVYEFGCYESKGDSVEKSIEKSAIQHYSRDDIWKYVTDIFVDDLTCANIISFMCECYVTDLCYMVPKGCGQVKGIIQKLNEGLDEKSKLKKDDWIRFRNRVADTFLFDEIKAVNPEYIILHGNSARKYFSDKISNKKEYLIEGSSYKIWEGILEIESKKYTVISIPHLKGIMKTMLWKNKKNDYEKYKSAKKILREIVKIN